MTTAPICPQRPHQSIWHGRTHDEPYVWLNDREDPEMLAYLAEENTYAEAHLADSSELAQKLEEEIRSRIKQDDISAPGYTVDSLGRPWWYYSRSFIGKSYAVSYRCPAPDREIYPDLTQTQPGEETLFDANKEAVGDFFALGTTSITPNGSILAYSVDHVGNNEFTLFIRDLTTGENYPETIEQVGSATWATDQDLLYTIVDEALRPWQLWHHRLGTSHDQDRLVYEESDERFWVGAGISPDERWVEIDTSAKTTSESWLLPVDDLASQPKCVRPRQEGVEYSITADGDDLFIVHDKDHPDGQLAIATIAQPDQWTTVLTPGDGERFGGISLCRRWLAMGVRIDACPAIRLYPRHGNRIDTDQVIELAEPLTSIGADFDDWYESEHLLIGRESFTTPAAVVDRHLITGHERVVKVAPVLPGPDGVAFDASQYVAERHWAVAPDQTRVPVSIIRHVDTPVDGTAPGLLYGYGAYDISTDPGFSSIRLALLNRGVVVAYAHIRGGGELGRRWYDDGRLANKVNTFTDFVACAQALIDDGFVGRQRLAVRGFSAGGLTLGAALNIAPELFRAAHVGVGFVDPLTTMLDPSLPLTVTEYDEWGNPGADAAIYDLMASYAPAENVRPATYPAILVTTNIHDSWVTPREPITWVARLRPTVTNDSSRPIILRAELVGGHSGESDRFAAWRTEARELAWIISQITQA